MDSAVNRRKPAVPGIRAANRSQPSGPEVGAKSLELSKVIRLLEDPLTANLKERHLFVLRKLLKRSHLLKELMGISRVLNICAEKVRDHPEYVPILHEALQICRLPFLKERTSDEAMYAQDVIDFLSHLGCLMRVSHAEVRQQVVESVKSFFSSVAPDPGPDGTDLCTGPTAPTLHSHRFSRLSLSEALCRCLWHVGAALLSFPHSPRHHPLFPLYGLQPTSPGYRLQLLELSDVAQTLLLSLAAVEDQPTIRLQLLQTLQLLSGSSGQSELHYDALSDMSDLNCALILNARGAESVCLHMNEPDPSGQVLFCSSEILSLKEAFLHLLLNGSRLSDLQLRNDLLVITTLIADNPNSLLIESLFAKEIVGVATFPELKVQSRVVHDLKLSYCSEDLRMKKLLLNLLVLMSQDVSALQLYREEHVMLSLLTLLKPPISSSERRSGAGPQRSRPRCWSSAQQEELQLQALATLSTIAPLLLDQYMSCQGNARLLLLLDWCISQDSYFGHGDSFHGAGGRGSKKAQMRHCVRVLRSVTSSGEESVKQDLCDQGTINHLLGVLMQMESSPDDEDDEVTLEIKSDIQLILSALCEPDIHRKELFGSEGVEMVVHFLRKGSAHFFSGLGHNKLLLSTVDCVWSCIVGCYTTEDYFLVKEGVFLLLHLLSSCPRCVHGVVLSTLLELCDNSNTVSHILSWREDGGQTAQSLLLQLWRDEEEQLGVGRSRHGEITDPRRPILSLHLQENTHLSLPADTASAAVLEVSENLRSKIYSIFCKLDGVTLSIVRRYLDFKAGEVWAEVSRELSLDGLRPVSPDLDALTSICRISEDTAQKVTAEQQNLLRWRQDEDVSEEQLMYTELKSQWKQLELTAKSWDSYVSRTSNYQILKDVRAQRHKHSEASQLKLEASAARPAQDFLGRVLAVDSTGAQGPAGVKVTVGRTRQHAAQKLLSRLDDQIVSDRPPPFIQPCHCSCTMIIRLGRLTPGYFRLLQVCVHPPPSPPLITSSITSSITSLITLTQTFSLRNITHTSDCEKRNRNTEMNISQRRRSLCQEVMLCNLYRLHPLLSPPAPPQETEERQVSGEVRMQPQSSFIDPIAMVMATVGTGGVCVQQQTDESVQLSETGCDL
ncbi:hypothetical protein INR49_006347 [Caranx melampygus]|nr:hypothetical protein INR49_006347 [Caranx melampygus]